jgi:hypothetical protein
LRLTQLNNWAEKSCKHKKIKNWTKTRNGVWDSKKKTSKNEEKVEKIDES